MTARLLRHLAAFGWETTVLTIAERAIVGPIDRAAYTDVLASLRVERVARWPRVLDLLNKARPRRARAAAAARASVAPSAPASFSWSADSGTSRLLRYLTFPDSKTGWVAPAVLRGRQLLREQRFDALLTISPPHSTHLAGLALHRLLPEVPWIAQLRDPSVPASTLRPAIGPFSAAPATSNARSWRPPTRSCSPPTRRGRATWPAIRSCRPTSWGSW